MGCQHFFASCILVILTLRQQIFKNNQKLILGEAQTKKIEGKGVSNMHEPSFWGIRLAVKYAKILRIWNEVG
ncbi:hypothetical protein C169_23020 [Paenibacillus sp. FSL R5-808]|nr:hypothetical protein C169_23020 [Paenibacillus sp. FSL R5-808]